MIEDAIEALEGTTAPQKTRIPVETQSKRLSNVTFGTTQAH